MYDVTVHQYDCFDTTQPLCLFGDAVFHAECVGDTAETVDGRFFDTVSHQLARNGDHEKRIVLKIDERYPRVVARLRQFFEVAHSHCNNTSCIGDLRPFPSYAFEVLFVAKRLAIVAPGRRAGGPHPLDAPNHPAFAECEHDGGSLQ